MPLKFKRIQRLANAAMVFAGTFFALAPSAVLAQDAKGAPIALGLAAPLTTQFAQNGKWMRQGVELAVKEINEAGGINGRPLELFVEDTQGTNPVGNVNAVTKLITKDQVVAIVGPHYTPGILAVAPLLKQYQVSALSGATGPVVTQQNNKFIFRVRLNDTEGAKLLVDYLTGEKKWAKIAIDYVNTAFGQGGNSAIQAELANKNIKPLITETHQDTTKDFTPQILSFNQANIDGLIVWTDDQPMGLIAKQMKTLNAKFALAGNAGLTLPSVISLAGDAVNDAISIAEFINTNPDETVQAWKARYQTAYGEAPELYASVYYDATYIIANAMKHASDISGPAIQEAIAKTQDLKGAVTTYTASPTGDMVHNALITRNVNQAPTIIQRVGASAQQ